MNYTPQSPVAGGTRGIPDDWIRWAEAQGAHRLDDVELYINTVYEYAPKVGLAAHKLVAQSVHETSEAHPKTGRYIPWTSEAWTECVNPTGIGVTGPEMRTWHDFENGRNAALAHLVRVSKYVFGPVPDILSPYEHLDPRGNVPASVYGQKKTLASFGHPDWRNHPTWATDGAYGQLWADTLNRLEPVFAGETTNGETPMAVKFEKRIATRRLSSFTAKLRDRNAHFTIHENGNPASSPYDEAAFVQNGGGKEGVLYTFSVGVENGQPIIVQIFPADRRGKHAGNAEGNATSLAVEVCQAPPGATSDMTQQALEELLYMVYTKDPRIDWGTDGDRYVFSPDRTRPHSGWPGANPGCPATMQRLWGGISRPVNNVRLRLVDPTGRFAAGDYVRVTTNLNIREAPGTGGTLVTTLVPDTIGAVIGGPVAASGYTWYDLRIDGFGTGWVADAWLELTDAPTPAPDPTPGPIVDYPAGMDREIARRLFGSVTLDGFVYQYNEAGPVSRLWLTRGEATGQYPQLQEVFLAGGDKYFVFSDGSVVRDPAGEPRALYIGTIETLTRILQDALNAA